MADVTYDMLDKLLGGRAKRETPCPFCSAQRKPAHRKSLCFGLMRRSADEIVFFCQNCGEQGKRSSTWVEGPQLRQLHRAESQRRQPPRGDRITLDVSSPNTTAHLAAQLWSTSTDPIGTPVEAYWLKRNLPYPIPPSVRFHPTGGQGKPTLVHAAGLPFLSGEDWEIPNVTGVHRTFIDLNDPKGRSHKQALGELRGKPCVCHVNPESLSLVIGEGLEKVTKFARAWNVDGWSACGKSFLPHLADAVGRHVEVVTILRDAGVTEEVDELARRLVERGMEVRIKNQPGEANAGS